MCWNTNNFFKLIHLCIILKTVHSLNDNYYAIENVYHFDDFQNKTNEKVYYKWIPPLMKPIRVNTSFFLYNFGEIDDMKSVGIYEKKFRWFDERLAINTNNNEINSLEGAKYHLKNIWTPSLHIPNNPFPDFLQNEDQRPVLTRIYTTGEVLVSKRINLKGFCAMDYTLYPLDKQFCNLEIESIAMSDDELRLDWSDVEPFTITDDFNWCGFRLTECTLNRVKTRYKMTGSFSKLVATFALKREYAHFIVDIYIPCILFVICSWTSFWVEIPAAPARVTLGLTSMLTLVTSAKTARDKLPKVSYIHALDIWLMMCTFFIFSSLVEYATVNYIYHKEKRHKVKQKVNSNPNKLNANQLRRTKSTDSFQMYKKNDSFRVKPQLRPTLSTPVLRRSVSAQNMFTRDIEGQSDNNSIKSKQDSNFTGSIPGQCIGPLFGIKPEDMANDIDRKCRILFPASFFITNIIYWTVLATLSSQVE